METGAIFVGIAMLVVSIPFVIRPFRGEMTGKVRRPNIGLATKEKRKADLSALLDLDFDYRTGKVSEDDYLTVRAQLVADAAQQFEMEKSNEEEQIEALIAARKAKHCSSDLCLECGHILGVDSRFCSQCGTAVAQGCPTCGKPVQEDDLFCTTCGAKLEPKVEAAA